MRATSVLVEGESDRVAVETLAARQGLDLEVRRVSVIAMGGATSIGTFLRRHGPEGSDDRLLGLCDAAEAPYVHRALGRAGLGSVVGFEVCDADLEDELVRCLGTDAVLDVIAAAGELASFRLLQRQPAQRGQPLTAQLRRFFAGRSGHKITYASLLIKALPTGVAPPPLAALLAALARLPSVPSGARSLNGGG